MAKDFVTNRVFDKVHGDLAGRLERLEAAIFGLIDPVPNTLRGLGPVSLEKRVEALESAKAPAREVPYGNKEEVKDLQGQVNQVRRRRSLATDGGCGCSARCDLQGRCAEARQGGYVTCGCGR